MQPQLDAEGGTRSNVLEEGLGWHAQIVFESIVLQARRGARIGLLFRTLQPSMGQERLSVENIGFLMDVSEHWLATR